MYRLTFAGYAWNPELREWEVFELAEDGAIQDLLDRHQGRADAVAHAERVNAQLTPNAPLQRPDSEPAPSIQNENL